MKNVVCIIDIDTTIADNEHRAVLLERNSEDKITQASWDQFLSSELMLLDKPQQHAKDVIDSMRCLGYQIVFLTGRNEKHYAVTAAWLKSHMGWNPNAEALLMRTKHMSSTPASLCKEIIFNTYVSKLKEIGYKDLRFLFFEDDKHVLKTWRKYGLVFQCPEAWSYMNPDLPDDEEANWSR